jgi:hypothetical protein
MSANVKKYFCDLADRAYLIFMSQWFLKSHFVVVYFGGSQNMVKEQFHEWGFGPCFYLTDDFADQTNL